MDATRTRSREVVELCGTTVPVTFVRHRRARRYILRLTSAGTAKVTLPAGGQLGEAKAFLWRNRAWLERQVNLRLKALSAGNSWADGSLVRIRGEMRKLAVRQVLNGLELQLGESRWLADRHESIKATVERQLRKRAEFELPVRVAQLADFHGLKVGLVRVRDQRSRWGSCSSKGSISLNWRLVQAPPFVQDYIILHELAHLRHLNHSPEFWAEVARMCPGYRAAELWLKTEGPSLR